MENQCSINCMKKSNMLELNHGGNEKVLVLLLSMLLLLSGCGSKPAENVGDTTDWLDDFVEYNLETGMPFLAEYEHKGALIYVGGGAGGAEDMANKLATTDATVLMETRATELIVENGTVVGVKAEGADAAALQATVDTYNGYVAAGLMKNLAVVLIT